MRLSPTCAGTNDLAPVLHLKTPDIQPLLRQTAQGCIHVLQEVAARLPETKLMVVAIMPRGWSQLRGERWKNNATDWRQPSVFTEVLDRTNQNVKVSEESVVQPATRKLPGEGQKH